ncbi:MAG: Biopolymer transport protein ExbB [Planctomycetota bacterium]
MLTILRRSLPSLALAAALFGQGDVNKIPFDQAATNLERQVVESVQRLAALREEIAGEKVPMSKRLSDLESELQAVRAEFQSKTRLLDSRTLDLGNLRTEIKLRQDEASYLSSLLSEYVRNFESGLHVAEKQRHAEPLQAAKLAAENSAAAPADIWANQIALIGESIDRLLDAGGGTRFAGHAADGTGLVNQGEFTAVGPLLFFRGADGKTFGTAEQRLDSSEPAVLSFGDPELAKNADHMLANREGLLPLDPTLGNAHKVAAIDETFLEHLQKGGPVVYPIVGIAGLALLVALLKWLSLVGVRRPATKRVKQLMDAVATRDVEAAKRIGEVLVGPSGEMLAVGVEHLHEPRELIEEVMYEKVLATKLRVQGWLPFIAITASSAPLLGLLGTVTGIMNTFSLMTLFGTGDVKTLSSGISEALITTELGLYVAIPSLILHAFLSRKAKAILDDMEKSAVALVNQIAKTPATA